VFQYVVDWLARLTPERLTEHLQPQSRQHGPMNMQFGGTFMQATAQAKVLDLAAETKYRYEPYAVASPVATSP
jgi:hypothetical protein